MILSRHQRKILDDTLPIRYSGLSNNAHLELVASPKSKKGNKMNCEMKCGLCKVCKATLCWHLRHLFVSPAQCENIQEYCSLYSFNFCMTSLEHSVYNQGLTLILLNLVTSTVQCYCGLAARVWWETREGVSLIIFSVGRSFSLGFRPGQVGNSCYGNGS